MEAATGTEESAVGGGEEVVRGKGSRRGGRGRERPNTAEVHLSLHG